MVLPQRKFLYQSVWAKVRLKSRAEPVHTFAIKLWMMVFYECGTNAVRGTFAKLLAPAGVCVDVMFRT